MRDHPITEADIRAENSALLLTALAQVQVLAGES